MDEEVRTVTGKGWEEWFSILDEFGAEERGHTLTVKHLMTHHGLDQHWARAVALRYENDRGLRDLTA